MGLFKKRRPPPAPSYPPMPTPAEVMDIIDEIAGTQTITVTRPDGKKQRITQRLPRTPQEEAVLKQADELMSTAVNNIQLLYQYDPTSIADYTPFIRTFSQINEERARDLAQIGNFADIAEKVANFKSMSKELMERDFDLQQRMSEELLAKRGWGNSTMAAEHRAAFAREKALAGQQAAVAAEQYGDDLMQRQLTREGNLYNIREAGRQGRLDEAQTGYNLERQKIDDEELRRQNAIAESQDMLGVGRNLKGDELSKSQLALSYSQNAQNLAHQQNVDQMTRYNTQINQIDRQYQNALDQWKNRPRSFGSRIAGSILKPVSSGIGAAVGGAASGVTTRALSTIM